MEQKQINLEHIYRRLLAIEAALKQKGIRIETTISEDDEGELTDEFKAELEKRRKSEDYLSHEEVKKRILARK